jgi:hypothetical protein
MKEIIIRTLGTKGVISAPLAPSHVTTTQLAGSTGVKELVYGAQSNAESNVVIYRDPIRGESGDIVTCHSRNYFSIHAHDERLNRVGMDDAPITDVWLAEHGLIYSQIEVDNSTWIVLT